MARAMDDVMTQFTKRTNKYATIDSGSEDVVSSGVLWKMCNQIMDSILEFGSTKISGGETVYLSIATLIRLRSFPLSSTSSASGQSPKELPCGSELRAAAPEPLFPWFVPEPDLLGDGLYPSTVLGLLLP